MEYTQRRDIVERTFEFALAVVRCCCELEKNGTGVQRILGKQLLRSGTSVGANVEEAQAGQSRADFASKMCIALKEARESAYWLRLMTRSGLLRNEDGRKLLREAVELSNILGAILAKLRRRNE